MFATLTLLALAVLGLPAQSDTQHRSDMVMGFDQTKTAHHFRLYTDGGAIEVSVRDQSDTKNREAIQSHLLHITTMFSEGDFDAPMLVHDSTNVPGTKVMTAKKAAICYRYEKTPDGGRISIVTTDAEALAAVHEFLRYQIVEHKTGDPTVPQQR